MLILIALAVSMAFLVDEIRNSEIQNIQELNVLEENVVMSVSEVEKENIQSIEEPIIKVEDSHIKHNSKRNYDDNYEDYENNDYTEENNQVEYLEDLTYNNLDDIFIDESQNNNQNNNQNIERYSTIASQEAQMKYDLSSEPIKIWGEKGKIISEEIKYQNEKARVILSVSPEMKQSILQDLEMMGAEIHSTTSNTIAFTGNKQTVEMMMNMGNVQNDLVLYPKTYEGFNRMNFEKVLNGRLCLDSTTVGSETSIYLNGTGEYTLTGKGQTIAVIDTGINNNNNPELNETGLYEWDYFNSLSVANDNAHHGTRMAGVMFAKGNKMQGTAYEANYVDLRVSDNSGNTWQSNIDNALDWCIANASAYNITTVYIGLGTGLYTGSEAACNTGSTATKIKTLTNMNITVVAPVGHDSDYNHIAFPACVKEAIAVGGVPDGSPGAYTPDTWKIAGPNVQSNRNDLLDVLAVGADGYTKSTYDTSPFWWYHNVGVGTSVSAAYVAGASVLMREYIVNNNVELINGSIPETISYRFKKSGKMIKDPNNGVDYPRLDFYRAIHYEENKPEVTIVTGNNSVFSDNITLQYSVNDESDMRNCTLYLDGSEQETHYFPFEKPLTCSELWGECAIDYQQRDNTFDSCHEGGGTIGSAVQEITINRAIVKPGDNINVECEVGIQNWQQNPHAAIFYYNGTGWETILEKSLPQGANVPSYMIYGNITVDNVEGDHWVRCSFMNRETNTTIPDFCAPQNTSSMYNFNDNDDMKFIVTNDDELYNSNRQKNTVYNFTLPFMQGIHNWQLACYDNAPIINFAQSGLYIFKDGVKPNSVDTLTRAEGLEWINWNWNNPGDTDFVDVLVYVNGVNVANLTTGEYNLSTQPDTTYTIRLETIDEAGNIGDQVNDSFTTLPFTDVAVTEGSIYSDVGVNQTITFDFTLENLGNVDKNVSWEFSTNGTSYTYGPFLIKSGEKINSAPIAKYDSVGNYTATLNIDYDNSVAEHNESNNEKTVSVVIQ